ncbi:MAG: hypothetical protein OJF50_001176 [Nitrospira sp.]|nr:hypothetical protein [Nitrospira sp.]
MPPSEGQSATIPSPPASRSKQIPAIRVYIAAFHALPLQE